MKKGGKYERKTKNLNEKVERIKCRMQRRQQKEEKYEEKNEKRTREH